MADADIAGKNEEVIAVAARADRGGCAVFATYHARSAFYASCYSRIYVTCIAGALPRSQRAVVGTAAGSAGSRIRARRTHITAWQTYRGSAVVVASVAVTVVRVKRAEVGS